MPLEGEFENLCHFSIGRMPGDRNLLSLNASLAIPTRILRFEDSGLRRHTPVRPVLLTCNTLKFSNFRMLIGKIIKQRFSHNFKILPKIYLLYRKFRIRKIN
jgi:uncharacterized protein YybS (DUF2232 family)